MRKLQNGFAGLLLLAVVFIVGGLAVAGWFVFQAQNPKSSGNDTAASEKQEFKEPKYLIIKEWGVQFKLPEIAEDATYSVYPPNPDPTFITLSSPTIINESRRTLACGASDGFAVHRYKVGEQNDKGVAYTAEDLEAKIKVNGAKVGEYYFEPAHGFYCRDNPAALVNSDEHVQKVRDTEAQLVSALRHLQPANE